MYCNKYKTNDKYNLINKNIIKHKETQIKILETFTDNQQENLIENYFYLFNFE